MQLEFRDLAHGWVDAVATSGSDRIVMNVSGAFDTEDGLAQFVDAAVALTQGQASADVCWTHESGEHWWTFDRISETTVRVRIVHVHDPPNNYSPRSVAAALVDEELELGEIVDLVLKVMEPLRNADGGDAYRDNWWHPYPKAGIKALRRWRARSAGPATD